MRVLIIGGGIAGATLAVALRGADVDVMVAEARPRLHDTGGAFLTLAPNGRNALEAVGLGDVAAAAGGFEVDGIDFHNARGRRIAELRGEDELERYGARSIVLRRARLHAELAERARAAGARFELGARLVGLREHPGHVDAELADGRTLTADALVGADGIWSAVRRLTWPEAPRPRYTGIVDCGGWTDVDLPDARRQQMTFGHRAFFGSAVRDGTAYWFTNVPRRREPARHELDDLDHDAWLTTVRRLHERDPAAVRAILAAAQRALGAWPIYDMPPLDAWRTDRICLIGDAAHAVSPSTGQGASLAIEDAVLLAAWLRQRERPRDAFEGFERERKSRAERVVRFGRQIGQRKAASGLAAALRDLTLGAFLRMGAAATAEQYGYRVPDVPAEDASPRRPEAR